MILWYNIEMISASIVRLKKYTILGLGALMAIVLCVMKNIGGTEFNKFL